MFDDHVMIFRALRDKGGFYRNGQWKPMHPADFAELRKPAPPSRALIARMKRHREARPFVETPRELPVTDHAKLVREQLEFQKFMISHLGGSRTVVASEPIPYGGYAVHEPHHNPRDREVHAPSIDVHRAWVARQRSENFSFRMEAYGKVMENAVSA